MKKLNSLTALLIAAALCLALCACGSDERFEWPASGLATHLPEPNTNEGTIYEGSSYFSAHITNITREDYDHYVAACKDRDYTTDAEESDTEYEAFDPDGYKVELTYFESSEQYDIWLDEPMYEAGSTFDWPAEGLAALIPEPESHAGKIVVDDEEAFAVYVGETTADACHEYIDRCRDAGFDADADRSDTAYYADNADGVHLEVLYQGWDTVYITLDAPETPAAESAEPEVPEETASEEPEPEITEEEPAPAETAAQQETPVETAAAQTGGSITLNQIPAYSGEPYTVINDNNPFFTEAEFTTNSYESYSNLDRLGRCGVAMACIGQDLMPTEDRESISSITPTGWKNAEYDFISGGYLYNRCHLIAFELAGENANEKNLITGTRYLNVDGMLPFENMVADYVKETNNHVLYRVTPMFDGDNLVAAGVLMEAESVEDRGGDILFNVFCYNVQPGVSIDYATGSSQADGTVAAAESSQAAAADNGGNTDTGSSSEATYDYILNASTKKFHYPTCSSVAKMKESNKVYYTGTRDEVIGMGYEPCGNCKP